MERDRELTVELGENPSVDDLLDHLGYLLNIDETKKETIKMIVKSQIIKVPRQLEHWHIIDVNAVDLRARCICKKCNCDGRCYWVDTFESIEFGLQPTIAQMPGKDPTVGYQGMVWQAVEMIKRMLDARPRMKNVAMHQRVRGGGFTRHFGEFSLNVGQTIVLDS